MRENNMMLEENAANWIRNVIVCGMLLRNGLQNSYFLAAFTLSLILWWFGGFVCALPTAFNVITG